MKFPKYPKIRLIGSEENRDLFNAGRVFIEEKLDGANIRIFIVNGKYVVGSRNVQITSDDGELQNERFRKVYDYIAEKLKGKDLSAYNGLVLFGEGMIQHTLTYDWDRIPKYIMYDVYDTNAERWLHINEVINIAEKLGFKMPRLVGVLRAEELRNMKIDDSIVPKSEYREGYAEGIVFKNYDVHPDDVVFAKYVRSEFREQNKIAFGGSRKYAKNDTEKVLFQCVTNRRIEKVIYALLNDGHTLDMQLMKYLPKAVWEDVIEECARDIMNSKYVIDFQKLRKMTAKRCVAVLQQMIVAQR